MKLALTCIVIFSFIGINSLDAQTVTFIDNLSHYIEHPTLFEEGQEDGRSYFTPEKNMFLNGNWKFFWSDTPEGVPSGFFESSFNDNRWAEISVPSNWEVKGYGDKLFRNISTSFKERPPFVSKEYNPTGSYRRNFTIPSDWKGEQVFLRFEKIASASFVWVNGVRIGYNEGAQEPSEYNITKYLKPGNNTLAVCVIKYCDGYYLEDQDYWRLAGIFDDVWLYAAPNVRLFDWQITTDFDESFTNATLNVNADIRKYTNDLQLPNLQMHASLYDKNNQIVSTFSSNKFSMNDSKIQVSLKIDINKPLKWASESPNLYTLYMELLDESGRIIDKSQNHIGFKKTEIRDGIFLLNGVPLKVHAQNSHMQHPEKGHVMDEQTIRKDFELLKQFNFNAVRTSHYLN